MAIEAAEEREQTDTSTEEEETPETPDDVEAEANEEGDPPETKPEDDDGAEETAAPPEEAKATTGLTVSLDAPEEEEAPPALDAKGAKRWKELREKERKLEELETRMATPATPPAAAPTLPPMPKSSDKDIGYDEEKLSLKMAEWVEKKAEVSAFQAQAKVAGEKQAQEWRATVAHYEKCAEAVTARNPTYPQASNFVRSVLSPEQCADLMESADDPAKIVLALYQNPDRAKELAATRSRPRFTKALVEMEKTMTVTPPTKRPKAGPERTISSGGGSPASSSNPALDKARANAIETGDYTEVNRIKNQQKQTQKK